MKGICHVEFMHYLDLGQGIKLVLCTKCKAVRIEGRDYSPDRFVIHLSRGHLKSTLAKARRK